MKRTHKESLISVVMPVFNADRYLAEAIDSILQQTYKTFEFIIIDDASQDDSWNLIKSYHDPRIILKQHRENVGIVDTLNEAISMASGEYVARMDADDISLPDRLSTQIAFLEHHPDIFMVGSLYAEIDETSHVIKQHPVVISPSDISFTLPIKNSFCHGSVMYRRNTIAEKYFHYSHAASHAEDYELWRRLTFHNIKMANIPETLYLWRNHGNNISHTHSVSQAEALVKLNSQIATLSHSFSVSNVWDYYISAISQPSQTEIYHQNLPTHLKREYQYVLISWSRVLWKDKPIASALAVLLAVAISPYNIIKKIFNG